MADFLSRLSQRALGRGDLVQPSTPSLFAPVLPIPAAPLEVGEERPARTVRTGPIAGRHSVPEHDRGDDALEPVTYGVQATESAPPVGVEPASAEQIQDPVHDSRPNALPFAEPGPSRERSHEAFEFDDALPSPLLVPEGRVESQESRVDSRTGESRRDESWRDASRESRVESRGSRVGSRRQQEIEALSESDSPLVSGDRIRDVEEGPRNVIRPEREKGASIVESQEPLPLVAVSPSRHVADAVMSLRSEARRGDERASDGGHSVATAPPTINVTIGRIEVRASYPERIERQRPATAEPALSLEAYLRQQNGQRS